MSARLLEAVQWALIAAALAMLTAIQGQRVGARLCGCDMAVLHSGGAAGDLGERLMAGWHLHAGEPIVVLWDHSWGAPMHDYAPIWFSYVLLPIGARRRAPV
jgi:hypothetical protein